MLVPLIHSPRGSKPSKSLPAWEVTADGYGHSIECRSQTTLTESSGQSLASSDGPTKVVIVFAGLVFLLKMLMS